MTDIVSHEIVLADESKVNVYHLVRKSNFQPEHMAEILGEIYNAYGTREFNTRLAKALLTKHRTFQQSLVRGLVAVLIEMGKQAGEHGTDPRNENAINFCRRLERLVEEEGVHFPLI